MFTYNGYRYTRRSVLRKEWSRERLRIDVQRSFDVKHRRYILHLERHYIRRRTSMYVVIYCIKLHKAYKIFYSIEVTNEEFENLWKVSKKFELYVGLYIYVSPDLKLAYSCLFI